MLYEKREYYLNKKDLKIEIYGGLWKIKESFCCMSYKYTKFCCCLNISNEFLGVFSCLRITCSTRVLYL